MPVDLKLDMKRIYLIGYMGSGKTTLGRLLAEKLDVPFVDLDHLIERHCAKSVGQLFQEEGEDEFRRIESRVLRELPDTEELVVSTGGGTPVFHGNMDYMNRTGLTVYLKVSTGELAARLKTAKDERPLIRDKSDEELLAFITEALARRETIYNLSQFIFPVEALEAERDIQRAATGLWELLENQI